MMKKFVFFFNCLFFCRNNFDIKENDKILFEYGVEGGKQSKTHGNQQQSKIPANQQQSEGVYRIKNDF
jgi:hypothetical protein